MNGFISHGQKWVLERDFGEMRSYVLFIMPLALKFVMLKLFPFLQNFQVGVCDN